MSDLDNIMKHWNTYEMRRFLGSPLPISKRAEEEWLEKATTQNAHKDGRIVLVIEDKNTREFLGTTSLFDISNHSRRAEFGIAIHNPEKMSKGYGTDATRLTLWIGFHQLGLNSIYLYTLSFNERAQRAYDKAGFKRAGILRKSMFAEGDFHDMIIMDILRDEFFEKYPPGTLIVEK
ncbi:MAG: GNAT family N-acetyltransferase [Candidatus Thorarchaeota archaeon]|nr:GNAT family N-acetyltransferase [Candidatus Thorarchaeota archaeon]